MLRLIAVLLAALQFGMPSAASAQATFGMKTGITLRMHVVAHDDTPRMQAIKLQVRDGVQAAYAQGASGRFPMLLHAARLMPELESAAVTAARAAGFSGNVDVDLTLASFDERTLDGLTIPAGLYPALVIRLGSAQGHNWWGLIDRQLALRCAAVGGDESLPVEWDWSFEGFKTAWHMFWQQFGL